MRVGISLLLLSLVAFWPQLSFPEWRGTEARRVQIAYEMLHSGDYMVPTSGGETTITKPPLHYWVLCGVMLLGGVGDLEGLAELDPRWLRLPSLLGFWVLSWIVFSVLRRSHGAGAGWASAVGILLAPVILHEGPTAEIDPLFACLTGVSLVLLAQGVSFRERRWLIVGGVAGGLALLSKGPPYFLFLAGPILVWVRHRRFWAAPYFILPLLAVPLAYYVPLVLGPVGIGELAAIAGRETIGRSSSYDWENLWEAPGYLLNACALVLPLGFWTLHEYRQVRNVRMQSDALLLRFCSASAVASVLLLLLSASRPTRYLLPAVPLFLIALGPAIADFASQDQPLTKVQGYFLLALGIVGALAVMAAPFTPYPMPGRSVAAAFLLALSPILVQRRSHLVPYALLMPLVVAWTVFPDRADYYVNSLRSLRPVASVLEREMDSRGVKDLQAFGHVRAAVQLYTKRIPPGDEFMRRDPATQWVIQEERGHNYSMLLTFRPPGYTDRVRVRGHDKTFALRERTQR